MIVSEDTVSTALAYLADDPHPAAIAHMRLVEAKNFLEATEASLYVDTEGTVRERDSQVILEPDVQRAKAKVAAAEMTVENHRIRLRWADKLIDTWRTENANIRAAERIR